MGTTGIGFFSAFLAGLLSFLSPCVLPLIPSYITYITGMSFAELDSEEPSAAVRKQTVVHSVAFIGGFTLVFVLLGASATALGGLLQEHMVLIRRIGGLLIIIFGIHVTGILNINFLLGERRLNIRSKPAGIFGSVLVGIAFAAGWTPCIGPILASILMVAATEGTVLRGILLLLAYSVGLGIPFFLSALALHRFLQLFNRYKKYIRIFEVGTGIFLIIIGIMIFTNYLSVLSSYATRIWGGL